MDSQSCPISSSQVNEWVSRANALVVLLLLVLFYFVDSFWIIVFLMADFFLRAFGERKISPISFLSAFVLKKLKVPVKPVNAGPKAFAAKIGCGFSFCVALSSAFSLYSLTDILVIVFAVCAFLEAFFGFCIGCKLYALLHLVAKKSTGAAGNNGAVNNSGER